MSTSARWILTAAAVILFLVSSFTLFFFRDNFSTHYPLKVVSAKAFRSAEIPYWNYHDGGGQPLAGNPNTLTFYPDNILYLALPAHIAFNLHFWIHLCAAFLAMRALTRSWFGAAMWAAGGIAISATAFYNLIVAVAMIPLAFLAVERRSAALLGVSFGLLILAGEPVMVVATALAVGILAFGRMSAGKLAVAVAIATVMAMPLLIAYAEISGEVERSVAMSARTVLNASLHPVRLAEIFFWPMKGFLNDAGGDRARLFSTVFVGLIALPALAQRSRFVAVVAVLLFLALGRYNPLVSAAIEQFSALRIIRYPEKFVVPAGVALVVLASQWFRRSAHKRVWVAITFLPLAWIAVRALPIDLFAPYDVPRMSPRRAYVESQISAGSFPARDEYRLRARMLEPLFGAAAGLRYVVNPSPEGMHSLRSRMVLERFGVIAPELKMKYLRIAGCDVPRALPPAKIARGVVVKRDIYAEVRALENPGFDEQSMTVAAAPAPEGRGQVTGYLQLGQTIDIDVITAAPALLVVNQTYFRAWDARSGGRELQTVPVNVDRLGVIVPAGRSHITLRFGKRRAVIAMAWVISIVTLIGALLVEKLNGRPGQIERPAHEDRPLI